MAAGAEKVDLIVVGAGLAGLSCAIEAAGSGLGVLVVERGDRPGAKNVSGGRLYLEPVRPLLPSGFLEEAPLERPVTHESLAVMAPSSSLTLDFTSESLREPPASFTVLRSRLDRWLGERAERAGAFVVPQAVATGLIRDGDRVRGVLAGDEELEADVVVAADGVLSFIAREAGLAPPLAPAGHALGLKEVLSLDPRKIEDRFSLLPGEGAARLYMGDLARGMVGGGFLYTNRDTISLGMVVSIEDLGSRPPDAEGSHELLDAFKARPEIRALVGDAETVEYSAHLVPELSSLPRRVADGLLVAGDAAGLALNHGVTVRGMDLAIASGVLAARACRAAKDRGDFGASSLAEYDRLLDESFVLADVDRSRAMPAFLARRRLHETYPKRICDLVEEIFRVGPSGKDRLFPPAWKRIRETFLSREGLSDLWAARKL